MNLLKKAVKKTCKGLLMQICIKFYVASEVYGRFIVRFLRGDYKKKSNKNFPLTIQLPITYKCNFDCVMCGMREMIDKPGFSSEELKLILNDHLFYKITSVGVNGGEPFLLKDLEKYIQVLLDCLPKLKEIFIISNGYFTDSILEKSKAILKLCKKYNVKLHLSISIDGYGEMQDKMRGKKGAFEHAVNTCQKILENQHLYCDSFKTLCTVTKINVYHLAELDVWSKQNNLEMGYNIATIHKRICNDKKYQDFSVFTDEHSRLMAAEFFYSKYLETKSETYYSLYYLIYTGKRIALCQHQTEVVTLVPDGGIAYCATHSNFIGNVFKEKAENIFFSNKNIQYRTKMQSEYCKKCSQYAGSLSSRGYLSAYAKDMMRKTIIYR